MDLINVKKIYFIGIGGIGMSAAAGIATECGYEVKGSDSTALYDPAKSMLEKFGISYHVGYDETKIANTLADIYIVSAGETPQTNPELAYVVSHELPYHSFSELLYELSKDFLRIVVAGTHGKSTTAGMLGHALSGIDDSSFMTGAVLQNYDTNFKYGTGHYFVFEGDEYKALYDDPTPKFHYYKPDILVLTNLEFDHPDVFASLDEMKDEFRQLIADMPDDGLIIYNADDVNLVQLAHETDIANFGFGLTVKSDYTIDDIRYTEQYSSFRFSRYEKGELKWAEPYLTQLAGKINVYNTAAVVACLRVLGFEHEQIQDNIDSYYGVKRRFEKVGERSGITIYDDYAHHPTAVRETLASARTRYPDARIWAVFEPHTYSRTAATLEDLSTSFTDADQVLIAEIYPAREQKQASSITGEQVIKAIKPHQDQVRLVADKQEALTILSEELKPGDVVVVMAVGSFNRLARELLQ